MKQILNTFITTIQAATLLLLFTTCNSPQQDDATVMLSDFPTMQQTTDYTCGCVAALMVMRYYGIDDETEQSLSYKMHTHCDSPRGDTVPGTACHLTDYGTNVGEIYRFFSQHPAFHIDATSYNPANTVALLSDTALVGIQAVGNIRPQFDDYGSAASFFKETLLQHHPIMVCWTEWGGHWTVIIGYDDNGTTTFSDDDTLIMADPYDTTDGKRDGMTRVPLVHFFYNWHCPMTPKPWQLQPYIVVSSH